MENLISLTCPSCGGRINIHDYKKKYFCDFCGNEVIVKTGSDLDKSINQLALASLPEQISNLNSDKQKLSKQILFFNKEINSVQSGKALKSTSLISLIVFLSILVIFIVFPALLNMGGIVQKILREIPGSQFLIFLFLFISFVSFLFGLIKYISISNINVFEIQDEREKVEAQLEKLVEISNKKQEELNNVRKIVQDDRK